MRGGVHIDPDCFEKFQDWVNFEVSKRLSLLVYLRKSLMFCSTRHVQFRIAKHLFLAYASKKYLAKF